MDAIFMSSAAAEKSVYPNKQQLIKNNIPWRNNSCGANFVSNLPNENLPPHTRFNIHGRSGSSSSDHLLFGPPFTYHPLLNPFMYQNHQQQQPPLLPLPVPNKQPLHSSVPYRTRSLSSSSLSNVKSNRNKDQSLTPRRSKSKSLKPTTTEATKKQAVNKPSVMMASSAAAKPFGPPPNDTSKVVVVAEDIIFTLSPPPSSLPLPSFSLRPKLSCKAQAASVDDVGASTDDNLRRLLRLPLN